MNPQRFFPPGKPRTDPLVHAYELIYQIADRLQTVATVANNATQAVSVTNSFAAISGGNANGGGAASLPPAVFTLSSNNNTTISTPSSPTDFYTVVLVQPANGNGGVIWGAGFLGASNGIDMSNNTISVFQFRSANINGNIGFVMTGQPTTGQTL